MANVDLVAPGKLLVLALTVVGCFAYIVASLFHQADTTPAWALMTLIVGYLIGNGVGAVRGVAQAPIFKPTDKTEQD
jgi:NhaP-type Na+/H+ or K+/H+ antiporter